MLKRAEVIFSFQLFPVVALGRLAIEGRPGDPWDLVNNHWSPGLTTIIHISWRFDKGRRVDYDFIHC